MPDKNNYLNFDHTKVKHELQDLIQGNGNKEQENFIQSIASYLRRSKAAGTGPEEIKYTKEQETKELISFINSNALWYHHPIHENNKIGEGAEQKVYYYPDKGIVVKLNDSIYFAYWEDYFHNLLLHNYFFPATQYKLSGFVLKGDILFAVVEQVFVKADEKIDLNDVRDFLTQNGFTNTRNNDYYNGTLGIILEDLHDENVINAGHTLFFIDTVFFLTKSFYII